MPADAERELALLLAQLRREERCRSGLAERLVPPDHDAAYRVAGLVADMLGWRRAGWKIAATGAAMQQALRTTGPICGRVFTPFVHASPASLGYPSLLHPIAECEYVATLGADLPARARPYGEDEVREAVASLAPGMEIAECRFAHDDTFPPLAAILADGSGSGRLVLGTPIPDWPQRNIAGQQVVLQVDGRERRRGTARDSLAHPLVPLTWLADALSRTGIGLRAGEIVSTGTCTGMLRVRPGEDHVADFGPFGEVRVRFPA